MASISGEKDDDDVQEWIPEDDDEETFGLEIIEDDDEEKAIPKDDEEVADSKKDRVQQRIDQLTASKYDEQRRAEAAEARLKEMQDRLDRIETGVSSQNENAYRAQYEKVKKDLFTAAEEGDTQKQVDLTEQLADMRADMKLYAARQSAPKQQQQAPANAQQAPAAAYAWWSRNTWFNSSETAAESAYAKQVDVQLEREGLDKNTPEYYVELDRRLQKKFPELYSSSTTEEKRPPRSPVAPSSSQGRGKSKGVVRLTREQANMAKELGITTAEGLKAYAKEIEGAQS